MDRADRRSVKRAAEFLIAAILRFLKIGAFGVRCWFVASSIDFRMQRS